MTEKRFKFNGANNCIEYDGKSILLDSYGEDIAELLNELHEETQKKQKLLHLSANKIENLLEENEQLKSKLLKLEEDRDYYKTKCGSLEEGYLKLQKENEKLKSEYKVLHTQYQDLRKFVENNFDEHLTQEKLNRQIIKLSDENEQLKTQLQNTSDQRDEFHRGARENANRVGKLEKENEKLKKELDQFYLLIGRGDWSGLVDLIKGDVE